MGIACMEYLSKKYKQENNEVDEKRTSSDEKLEKETSEEVSI